jgi:hypothetical protein
VVALCLIIVDVSVFRMLGKQYSMINAAPTDAVGWTARHHGRTRYGKALRLPLLNFEEMLDVIAPTCQGGLVICGWY